MCAFTQHARKNAQQLAYWRWLQTEVMVWSNSSASPATPTVVCCGMLHHMLQEEHAQQFIKERFETRLTELKVC